MPQANVILEQPEQKSKSGTLIIYRDFPSWKVEVARSFSELEGKRIHEILYTGSLEDIPAEVSEMLDTLSCVLRTVSRAINDLLEPDDIEEAQVPLFHVRNELERALDLLSCLYHLTKTSKEVCHGEIS